MYNKKQLNKIKTLTQTLKQEQTKYHTKNEKIRQTIRDWVDLYNPHYFLTINIFSLLYQKQNIFFLFFFKQSIS